MRSDIKQEYKGFIFVNNCFSYGTVYVDDGIITKVECDFERQLKDDEISISDLTGEKLIIPGLIDIHLHGAAGSDICDGTKEAIDRISEYEMARGVVAFCAATMTIATDDLKLVLQNGAKYLNEAESLNNFKGFYLEGPFISKNYCGAQREECVLEPDDILFEELIDIANDNIRFALFAPEKLFVNGEKVNSQRIIKIANDKNIHLAMGHSDADYSLANAAFNNGFSQVTHLFNAMKDMKKRETGIAGAAFDNGGFVELIADGVHLSDTMLRMAFKLYDEDKIILISDSMRATGLADGEYSLGGQKVFVKGNEARLINGTLAGSVTDLRASLINAIKSGVNINKAIKAATINPAKRLGIDNLYGTIEVGKFAPIEIFL